MKHYEMLHDAGIAEQQRVGKQDKDDSIKQFNSSIVEKDLCSIQLKHRQDFPISKLVSENSIFSLCRSQLKGNHLESV